MASTFRIANFGDTNPADHEVLSEENESRSQHHDAVEVQDFVSYWISKLPNEEQYRVRYDGLFAKMRAARSEIWYYSHTFDSLKFIRACEDFSWNEDKSTPYRSETNGIAENAVRRVQEGISALLDQSGLSDKWSGQAMECYCNWRNTQGQTVRQI